VITSLFWWKIKSRIFSRKTRASRSSITGFGLRTTAENLIHLEDRFKLEIWATLKDDNQDPMFDASLKIVDQMDAATFVWGHTEMWMKWDDAQEKDLKQQIKASNKPLRAKVTKDGRVRVKVTVTSLED
jgi:hypothetical protein